MWNKLLFVLVVIGCVPLSSHSQAINPTVVRVATTMGAIDLKSLQYTGHGSLFAVGQSASPGKPWPRFNVLSYTRAMNYDTGVMRDEILRTQGEQPPHGGGGQPLVGEQRQVLVLSGTHAWNQVGENVVPALAAVFDRQHQLWITPHGVIKAALRRQTTVQTRTEGNQKLTVISFIGPDNLKVNATANERNLITKVESWSTNPVLGDMLTETTYADYKDYGGVQFPTTIIQRQGGFPALELTISAVTPHVPVDVQVPDPVRQASVRVEANQVADGVWYLTGGTHHSVLVEMQDHLLVIEGPQNDERATAVIAEVKRLVPHKPLKYVVNSHHHFDHAGGLGAFVAAGAAIMTHAINKPFLERGLAAPRAIQPDKLAQSGKRATVEGISGKRVLADSTRTVELYPIQGSIHDEGIIMAYLPKEKLLVEADVYTPGPPNAPPPTQVNPNNVNLYENIERLQLSVERILPLHGRIVPLTELARAIGK